jgi:hypothetical protein
MFKHMIEPVQGYSLDVYRSAIRGEGEWRAHILLSDWEALGLAETLSGSMTYVSFGVPAPQSARTSSALARV